VNSAKRKYATSLRDKLLRRRDLDRWSQPLSYKIGEVGRDPAVSGIVPALRGRIRTQFPTSKL
jgi:hypothetical protein